ncbi:hypothetical protein PINS_up000271 [Pythium insidiosum]|nr:hypothetical protein PINS_up000271 [Pythium insidiosum]
MMAPNVVPSVVLHFHGFRSKLLASLWDACWIIMTDVVKKAIMLTLAGAAVAVLLVAVKGALLVVLQGSCFVWTINATFWACEGMAVACAGKSSALLNKESRELLPSLSTPTPTPAPTTDKLPRLQVANRSIAVIPESDADVAETTRAMDKLTALDAFPLQLPRLRLSTESSQALHHRAPSSFSLSNARPSPHQSPPRAARAREPRAWRAPPSRRRHAARVQDPRRQSVPRSRRRTAKQRARRPYRARHVHRARGLQSTR